MKIEWDKPVSEFQKHTYYDVLGEELREGDIVLMGGREWDVMLSADGCLGVDSTNPKWIASGRAVKGEYGIYPFEPTDEPMKIKQ